MLRLARQLDRYLERHGVGHLVRELFLVIEVLSPSTRRADPFTKRRRYQEARVPYYWIVDADAETVEVWTPEAVVPVIEREQVTWRVDQTAEEMVLPVGEASPRPTVLPPGNPSSACGT